MSTKLSLRFVKERFNVVEHLDGLEYLQHNHAMRKNMEKTYITKVVNELKGAFHTKRGQTTVLCDNPEQAEVIVFTDGSQAKNPLFRETITHRIAKQMGHA